MSRFKTTMMALGAIVMLNSCGTIGGLITHGKRPVYLVGAPRNLEVRCEGEQLELKMAHFATSENSSAATGMRTVTQHYVQSVRLPYKSAKTLELSAGGKHAEVKVKSKGSGAIIIGDLFFTGPLGIIIDVVTKNHRVFKPKFVDVQAALNGEKWKSQHKLKRRAKKGR